MILLFVFLIIKNTLIILNKFCGRKLPQNKVLRSSDKSGDAPLKVNKLHNKLGKVSAILKSGSVSNHSCANLFMFITLCNSPLIVIIFAVEFIKIFQ